VVLEKDGKDQLDRESQSLRRFEKESKLDASLIRLNNESADGLVMFSDTMRKNETADDEQYM